MITTTDVNPMYAAVEALLDRFDPPGDGVCSVAGCIHHGAADHRDATWVGRLLAAA